MLLHVNQAIVDSLEMKRATDIISKDLFTLVKMPVTVARLYLRWPHKVILLWCFSKKILIICLSVKVDLHACYKKKTVQFYTYGKDHAQ